MSIIPFSIYYLVNGNLNIINLSHNHLYNNSFKINSTSINSVQYNILSISTLTELNLKGNELEGKGITDIFNSHFYSSRLRILNMSCILYCFSLYLLFIVEIDTGLSEQGLYTLSNSLSKMRKLKELYLNGNNINHYSLFSLCKSLSEITELEVLDLRANHLDDNSALLLSSSISVLPQLKQLLFSRNSITANGESHFKKLNSNIHFDYQHIRKGMIF